MGVSAETTLTQTDDGSTASASDWPIVYVRAPRYGDGSQPGDRLTVIPESNRPTGVEPGTDLMQLKPDGTEEVLVEAGEHGAVLDPKTLDGVWVYYSFTPDARHPNPNFKSITAEGADVYRINVETRQVVRLTHQEWTPNRGAINWSRDPRRLDAGQSWPHQQFMGWGVYNIGAQPLPGGRVIFTSSRNGLAPNGGSVVSFPNLQLFLMDDDGKNVEQVGYLNLQSALHPILLKDGRILWSSNEGQGHRAGINWSIWTSYPDGRRWEPQIFSSGQGGSPSGFHWQGQWSDGDVLVAQYYADKNGGFGELYGFPATAKTGLPMFGHPKAENNPQLSPKYRHYFPFQRQGLWSATKWTVYADIPAPGGVGKASMPSGAPGDTMLVCYSPGPVHSSAKPYLDSGLYLLTGKEAASPAHFIKIKNDPAYNELQPIALVPWEQIYGELPPVIDECPDSDHPLLPPGTPFGLVGTSSFYARETWAANRDNFGGQGSNATPEGVEFDSALIDRVRLLQQEPTSNTCGAKHFSATGSERLKVIGEVPLRKPGVTDAAGDPDTSFLARVPADTSFTFQVIGADGLALTTAQTWHQVRPGETRTDCRGCHAHHEPGIEFAGTAASLPDYPIADLARSKPWTVEYRRDVLPIFAAKCQSCHAPGQQAPTLDASFHVKNYNAADESQYAFGYSARTSSLYAKMAEGHGGATPAEALTVGHWIDLGCQSDRSDALQVNGTFVDDQKPTLFVQSPRRKHQGPLTHLRFGAYDASGIAATSVKATFAVNGRAAGAELADLFAVEDSVHSVELSTPYIGSGELTVVVTDATGIEQKVVRSFATSELPPPPRTSAGRTE